MAASNAVYVSAALNIALALVFLGLLSSKTSLSTSAKLGAPIAISRGAPCVVPGGVTRSRPAALIPRSHNQKSISSLTRVSAQPHVAASVPFAPPPVSATTQAFHAKFKFPLPMIFASFVTRLLTEQHFVRYHRRYDYNPVFALGVCSVFDQVFESLGEEKKTELFEAFIQALGEEPADYRKDQASMEEWAKSKSASDIIPKADGDNVEQVLAEIAASSDTFLYSKFFSIGLFRLLELTGAKDPKALEGLVSSLSLRMDPVIRDLNYYKSSLSALIQAQELKRESEARAKKKRAETMAKKTEAIKKMAGKQM